jgi:hypothetical protein
MKLIDHTPYLTEKGELSVLHKLMGTIRFGDFWVEEIKAQKAIVQELDRSLVPGYTLLRNIQLPGSKITYPLVLVGPTGVFLLSVTTIKGRYHAIEGSWELETKGKTRPARPNLMRQTSMMAQAVQKYLEQFGLKAGAVEGVLIAADLALYIHKENPIVRIVMRDTIELFTDSLNQAEVVLTTSSVNRIVDAMTEKVPEPRSEVEMKPLQGDGEMSLSAGIPAPELEEVPSTPVENKPLEFGGDSTPWNLMEDFKFEPDDNDEQPAESNKIPVAPLGQPAQKKARKLQLSKAQWIVLVSASVVVILLLVFIFNSLSNIM